MTTLFTYGRHWDGDDWAYAVARGPNRTHGVWDAVEIDHTFYEIIDFDEIPECDWDRVDALEEKAVADTKQ